MADTLPAAERLRARMAKLEWSQTDLARVLGVSTAVVSRWLSGERTPSLDMAFRIERSKMAIPAEAWITHAAADESGELPALPADRPSRRSTG
jgi:transcriptional regulator with XRE-family HTH domain